MNEWGMQKHWRETTDTSPISEFLFSCVKKIVKAYAEEVGETRAARRTYVHQRATLSETHLHMFRHGARLSFANILPCHLLSLVYQCSRSPVP